MVIFFLFPEKAIPIDCLMSKKEANAYMTLCGRWDFDIFQKPVVSIAKSFFQ